MSSVRKAWPCAPDSTRLPNTLLSPPSASSWREVRGWGSIQPRLLIPNTRSVPLVTTLHPVSSPSPEPLRVRSPQQLSCLRD